MKAAIAALSLSLLGWLVWLFAWVAEADTGYPSGLACTANPETSEAYASCMRSAERGGAIAWSLTLGLAVAGIVMVVRSRRGRLLHAGGRSMSIVAGVFSWLLAVAGVNVWVRGATGAYYEDRLGTTAWHLTMIIAVGVGFIVGWAVTRRREEGPGGSSAESVPQGMIVDEGQSPPQGWWLASDGWWYSPESHPDYVPPKLPPTLWLRWAVVGTVVAVLWIIGLNLEENTATQVDDRGPVQQEEWRIALDDRGGGIHTVFMIRTFSPLEEADIDNLGGRLVWEETEIELCGVGIRSVGDGFVQVGDIFGTHEGCDNNDGMMQEAFDDLGLPQTACVFVRSNGVEDEHCAPLASG